MVRPLLRAALLGAALVLLSALGAAPASATQASVPGDYPDPTVTQLGSTYLATATSDRWEPVFPLMTSTDLRTWTQIGSVFQRGPAWATGHRFWAPELTQLDGRLVLTYSGLKRSGQWCVAVATAPGPGGPWTDLGPRVCPADGVIDSWLSRDPTTGTTYLLYKAKGVGGAIFGVTLDPLSFYPTSGPVELVAPQDGDRGVAEGPALVFRDGWWYLLFATGNCCRPPCTYTQRVARSRSPLGPYERARKALIATDEAWRCTGHGTPVSAPDGGLALLHHAYPGSDVRELRRWSVLTRLTYDEDGWPVRVPGDESGPGPSGQALQDAFLGPVPSPAWQWPGRGARPAAYQEDGRLALQCGPTGFLARQFVGFSPTVAGTILPDRTGAAGLAFRDQTRVTRGVEVRDGRARAVRRSARGAVLGSGPPVRTARERPVRVRLAMLGDGRLDAFVTTEGIEKRLTMSAARTGLPPTRLAFSCAGTGVARLSSLRSAGAVAVPATAPLALPSPAVPAPVAGARR